MMKQTLVVMVSLVVAAALGSGCEAQKGASAGYEKEWVYTVKPGDASFADISTRVYGDAKHADQIAKANPTVDEKKLQPGEKLVINELRDEKGQPLYPKECDRRKIY